MLNAFSSNIAAAIFIIIMCSFASNKLLHTMSTQIIETLSEARRKKLNWTLPLILGDQKSDEELVNPD